MQKSELTQKALDQAMAEFESLDHRTRCFWATTTALKNHLDERMAAFKEGMHNFTGNPLHLGNSLGIPLGEVRCQTELANSKVLIDFLTNSAEYAEADKLVRPAVEKIEALQTQLRDEQNAEAATVQARMEALEARKAEAVAKIEAEFEQAKPQAPSEPEPIKLVRGKNLASKPADPVEDPFAIA